jgi:hypothetical protein
LRRLCGLQDFRSGKIFAFSDDFKFHESARVTGIQEGGITLGKMMATELFIILPKIILSCEDFFDEEYLLIQVVTT